MMKQVEFKIPVRMLALICGLFLSISAFAQQITVNGHVKDATGEGIIGATVRVIGQDGGTITDFDGNFVIKANQGATIEVSYVGYQTARIAAAPNVVITLQDDSKVLDQVVVIGYGRAKKSDLTGSVTAIKPDDMNHGLVTNAQDMMSGKIAGVNVISDGGKPGGGASIRIRGGASLSASNDPLIVIDGLAMDNNGVQGLSNPLSMVNPNDIESFTVLKDASATAIYGSRASNGVIIITTKKGAKRGGVKVSYNGNVSISTVNNLLDVMDGNEYREFVGKIYGTDSDQYALLGAYNTDWQKEIYRDAVSTDHNLTVTGNVKGQPFRVTVGGTVNNGVIKTSSFDRLTASANFSPSFFEDHLNVNANLKGMWAKTRYADQGVVGTSLFYDPTRPVKLSSSDAGYNDYLKSFGGYFQWTAKNEYGDSTWPLAYNAQSNGSNPVATLEYQNNSAISRSLIGNLELDYKIHGFEDLRLHANGGMDLSKGNQHNVVDPLSAYNNYYGLWANDITDKYNLLLNMYADYAHEFGVHNLDIMGGYEWQHFHRKGTNYSTGWIPSTNSDVDKQNTKYNEISKEWANESFLVSFFGRMNYTLLDRYMLTATFRADGSSKFHKDHRWGYFPSVALAWRINQENFLKDVSWLDDLKLRLGYGITGQQEGISEYSYFNSYVINQEHAFYPISGDGTTYRPNAYNKELTWEKTTTWNAGIDFSALNGRFTLAADWYFRKTKDLLQTVTVGAGTNFSNRVLANTGTLENTGFEIALGGKPVITKDFTWDLQFNFTYNHNEITKMGAGIPAGGIDGATGHYAQMQAQGHPAYAFYVYQQVYDENGNAIEGVFVDRDGNGVINSNDKYFYKKPAADVLMGLSSKFLYKNWDLSFSLRASLNNYVYNNVEAAHSNIGTGNVYYSTGYFNNFVKDHTKKAFQGINTDMVIESDLWVQNASFLKCDNITLGYSFNKLFGANISGRAYATVQNVFTITDYKGLDPEVDGGIDNNVYPRPLITMVGLNLNF